MQNIQKLMKIAIEELACLLDYTPTGFEGFWFLWKKHFAEVGYTTIDEVIKEAKQKNEKVNLVGHSFGGLIGFKYALEHPDDICKCLTISTPFKGTPTAYLLVLLLGVGIVPKSALQILPDNEFCKALMKYFKAHNESETKEIIFENLRSVHDEFALFGYTALKEIVPDAKNVEECILDGRGHVATVYTDFACKKIADVIKSGQATILVPGYGLTSRFFQKLTAKMLQRGFVEEKDLQKTFHVFYDYSIPIKADKILNWYCLQHRFK